MTLSTKVCIFLATMIVSVLAFDVGERLAVPGMHSFVSTAEAVVGRPLTPVSVAGVARRSSRR